MSDRRTPLQRTVDSVMKCTVCGAPMGKCDCWTKCSCGWSYRKGSYCTNPIHHAATGER